MKKIPSIRQREVGPKLTRNLPLIEKHMQMLDTNWPHQTRLMEIKFSQKPQNLYEFQVKVDVMSRSLRNYHACLTNNVGHVLINYE